MDHEQQIKLRRLLKKNGFVKSDTSHNKCLMEFTKNDMGNDDFIIIYTYEIVEVYFSTVADYVILTLEQFVELYKKHTNEDFIL